MDTVSSNATRRGKRGRSNSPHSEAGGDDEKVHVSLDETHDEEGAVDIAEQRAPRDAESEDEADEDSAHSKRAKFSANNEADHESKEPPSSQQEKDSAAKSASEEEPRLASSSSSASASARREEDEHREAEEKAGEVENDLDDIPLVTCPTYNIFVANLGREVTKEDLRATYSVCGPIHSTTIVRDKKTLQSKNFGFVHFLSAEARDKALETMRGTDIKGRVAKAYTAENKNILFVGNIPQKMSETELKAALEDKGKFPISSLRVAKGFAFVTYINFHMAEKALKNLTGQVLENRRLTVEPAKNKKLASSDGRSSPRKVDPPSTLFIRNISNELTEEELKKHFDPYGRIAEARIVKDAQTGKNKGFAFVEFGSASSAENAKRELADVDLGGRRVIIEFAQSAGSKKANNTNHSGRGRGYSDRSALNPSRRFFARGDRNDSRRDNDSVRGGHSRGSSGVDPRAFGLPMLPPVGARPRDDFRGGRGAAMGVADRAAPPFQMIDNFGMPVNAMPVAFDEYSGQLVLLTPQQHAALQQQYGRGLRGVDTAGTGAGDRDRHDRDKERVRERESREDQDKDRSRDEKAPDRFRSRVDPDDRSRDRDKFRDRLSRDKSDPRDKREDLDPLRRERLERDREPSPHRERDRDRDRDRDREHRDRDRGRDRDDRGSRGGDSFAAFPLPLPSSSSSSRHRDERSGRARTHNPY